MSGIYLHIPFCKQSCHYCDFHFSTSLKHKEELLSAMIKELESRSKELKGKVETIYFGGGTPSLLNEKELMLIFETIFVNFSVDEGAEITLEANPDDLDAGSLEALSRSPINRLSIGIQSFYDKDLLFMNRAHNGSEAVKSLDLARRLFENISMDLIYGIPGQSDEEWMANLNKASDFDIKHLSCYALTLEEGTAFHHFVKTKKMQAPQASAARRHYEHLQTWAPEQGFEHYEVSNFGYKNFISRHNTSYWQGKSYLGIGPSAHSFDGSGRSWNVSNNARYRNGILKGQPVSNMERLTPVDRANELIMTGLRTQWGVSIEQLQGLLLPSDMSVVRAEAAIHLEKGVLMERNRRWYLNRDSWFLADGIASDLFLVED